MDDLTGAVERAREAFERRAWREACAAFAAATERGPLAHDDHERHAVAAYLTGADAECEDAFTTAHRAALDVGKPADAARCAVLLALCLLLRGQQARAGGWLGRAQALVEETGDCAAAGYLLVPQMLMALDGGDADAALALARRATEFGERFGEADLVALGVLGQGQARILDGDVAAGVARLDEVMLAVAGNELGPVVTGITYCAVIIECLRLHDLPRAWEWTQALTEWCEAQPDLVPYQGQCLVHRSQLQQAAGHWTEARRTAELARRRLAEPPHPALGDAQYQQGELLRLTGAFDAAEAEYRDASRHGHDPMPGLALLQLARGESGAATAGIRRALAEVRPTADRPALLAAGVEIFLAVHDVDAAGDAARELSEVAASSRSAVLDAMAAQARGALLLARGDVAGALAELRAAVRGWQALSLPYDAARACVLVGMACAALGDATAAELELGNARDVFAALGARPDLDRLAALTGRPQSSAAVPATALSPREREVLAHVAAGRSNREIAHALVLSEHTVRRHVEHIFAKLDVTSRAAATARAYQHGLL